MSGSDYGISAAIGAVSSAIGANANYIQNKKLAGIQEQYTKDNMAIAQQYNQANVAEQERYNTASTAQAQQYATEMANTQYQRGTADLKAAGLNPILAAGGQVDASPQVSAAQTTAPSQSGPSGPQVASSPSGWNGVVSSAISAANAYADIKNKLATNAAINAQAAKTNADAANAIADKPRISAQAAAASDTGGSTSEADYRQKSASVELTMQQEQIAHSQAMYASQQAAAQVAATNASATASSASAQNSLAQSNLAKENLYLNPVKTGLSAVPMFWK